MTHTASADALHDRQPINWISVAGFKSIASVHRLPVRRINVLIGSNGSGKSNLLGVFSLLESIRAGRLEEYVARAGGGDRVLHRGTETTGKLSVSVSFANASRYDITLVPDDSNRLVPLKEVVSIGDMQTDGHPLGKLLSSPGTEAGFLRHDGSRLAAFLYLLKARHGESYDLIRRTIRLVVPFFDDFVLATTSSDENTMRLVWKHVGRDIRFDASALSGGTLRFMALTALLLQPVHLLPSVILLDAPELGLHPYAVAMMCSMVKAASVHSQVFVATQSPLVLDHFEPEDVLVAERRNGASTFTRLQSADVEAWLDDYSLGQLWEKNELGGRPSVETSRTI